MRRVALVTGGARRLGEQIVRGLTADGVAVALHHNSSRERAEALALEITENGGQCRPFHADLQQPEDLEKLVPAVVREFGRIDVLINNASYFDYDVIGDLDRGRWDHHLSVNFTAPIFMAKEFVRHCSGDDPVIVNILDHKVIASNPDYFSYTAGKVALAGMTSTLALACAPKCRVCGVSPGLLLPSGPQTEAEFRAAWVDTPLKRGATLSDIVDAVRFIIDCPALTGQNLTVDGGEHLVRRARDVAFEPK